MKHLRIKLSEKDSNKLDKLKYKYKVNTKQDVIKKIIKEVEEK